MEEFKKMLKEFSFSKGTYVEIDYEKDEEIGYFGDFVGILVVFHDLHSDTINEIYDNLRKKLVGTVEYYTHYESPSINVAYYYGQNIDEIKRIVNQYSSENSYSKKITIMDMPTTIKELKLQ